MKDTRTCTTELEDLLHKEIELLGSLHACQKRMYESVLVRDWVRLQKETAASETISDSFIKAEENRLDLVRALHPGAEGSKDFYAVTISLPEPERSRINGLFRDLKKSMLLSKSENDVLNTYVTNARTLVSGLIESIQPARRNKIYTRHGSLASAQVESIVLNRSF